MDVRMKRRRANESGGVKGVKTIATATTDPVNQRLTTDGDLTHFEREANDNEAKSSRNRRDIFRAQISSPRAMLFRVFLCFLSRRLVSWRATRRGHTFERHIPRSFDSRQAIVSGHTVQRFRSLSLSLSLSFIHAFVHSSV